MENGAGPDEERDRMTVVMMSKDGRGKEGEGMVVGGRGRFGGEMGSIQTRRCTRWA